MEASVRTKDAVEVGDRSRQALDEIDARRPLERLHFCLARYSTTAREKFTYTFSVIAHHGLTPQAC